jgi:hypothetical protein
MILDPLLKKEPYVTWNSKYHKVGHIIVETDLKTLKCSSFVIFS